MKVSDVFNLPAQRAVNELAIIDKNDCVIGWADAFSGEKARDCFVLAVNNHDNLVETLRALVNSSAVNEEQLNDLLMCSDYGESEALCKARQLLTNLE